MKVSPAFTTHYAQCQCDAPGWGGLATPGILIKKTFLGPHDSNMALLSDTDPREFCH